MKRAALAGLLLLMPMQTQAQAQTPPQWTAAQDHQNMMDQLHIKSLRPGVSGDDTAPNHANYDEAKANPYPDWPDLMTLKSGTKVTSAAQWWNKRRPEIAEDLEREMYGRIPAVTPEVTWTATASEHEFIAFQRVTATQLVGHADNAADPAITADISAMLVLPDAAKGPVPVLIMFVFGPAKFPAPAQPSPEDAARINAALKVELAARDPSLAEVFAKYPGYDIATTLPFPPPASSAPDERISNLIRDGWGVLLVNPTSYQADNGAGLMRGIIGLVNHGQPRKPDDWGSLRAWEWGASRALDYLSTLPQVDAKHVGIEGVSRFGKAALVTMAFDQRFAFALIGSSGEGGAKPSRRNMGEAVENLTSDGEYHWMAGNFLKYGGPETPGDLPVDAHELIALCAPRPVFISYGAPAGGDPKWLDQQGSFMATVAAGEAWTLLGAKDLGVGHVYRTAQLPPVGTSLTAGQLAWRQHEGGHTDAPNMTYFLKWADAQMGRTSQLP